MAIRVNPKKLIRNWYADRLEQGNLLGQTLRKVRRFYLGTFRTNYISETIRNTRSGECLRCGSCCKLIYRCPFLGKDASNKPKCLVYGVFRPANCRFYPFDKFDTEINGCGYQFRPRTVSLLKGHESVEDNSRNSTSQ